MTHKSSQGEVGQERERRMKKGDRIKCLPRLLAVGDAVREPGRLRYEGPQPRKVKPCVRAHLWYGFEVDRVCMAAGIKLRTFGSVAMQVRAVNV